MTCCENLSEMVIGREGQYRSRLLAQLGRFFHHDCFRCYHSFRASEMGRVSQKKQKNSVRFAIVAQILLAAFATHGSHWMHGTLKNWQPSTLDIPAPARRMR